MADVIALDAGTTGARAIAFDESGAPVAAAYREIRQHFPRPGWVEHDPADIWEASRDVLASLVRDRGAAVAAVGVANQRETVVAWDSRDGRPLHRAIVWQDRRTTARTEELAGAGQLPAVRSRTGLVLDPYFSATKIEWLLREKVVEADRRTVFGTVDSWLLWNLTGGPAGGALVTDATNASRTMLYDIVERRWSEELCELFGVPIGALPEVRPSSGRVGLTSGGEGLPAGIPVSGVAGDQHAALFGQACFEPGMAKATYGTGSFVLQNAGQSCPAPPAGLLTTLAWDLGGDAVTYALEGSAFASGATVQWLRDGLGLVGEAASTEPLARSVADTRGVYVVPAFAGLGSPWWDPTARGVVTGISRGAGAAHLARAAVEAMAFQTRDVVEAMVAASGRAIPVLRADGGASVMDLLLQIQADQLQATVARPLNLETTSAGAAYLAGLAEGVWGSLEELAGLWRPGAEFHPESPRSAADSRYQGWLRALDRSRRWARA